MIYQDQSEDYRPLFWLGGRPIYVTTLLIILHVAALVITTICVFYLGSFAVYENLVLDTYRVLHYGEVWRLISYIIFTPSLWFVFAMGFLYFAGREVEQFVGRKVFMAFYAAVVLVPAVLLCVAGLIWPMQHFGGTESIYGVFVAFATIYPGIHLNIWFINLSTKAWAWVLFAIYTLIDFSGHDWSSMSILWLSAAVGYLGMRLIGAGRGMSWLTDWLEERRARRLANKHNIRIVQEQKAAESLDAILEKISRQGVGSLNSSERAALERARANLIKRDQKS